MTNNGAIFSPCRTWRYALFRYWNRMFKHPAMFIGLNCSTADEVNDDPTVTRCINFAHDWGYGGLIMTNLFAFRATDPKVMKAALDPVGPANDDCLLRMAPKAGIIVAAWGNHGRHRNRGQYVLELLRGFDIYALGMSKLGEPLHPLYLRRVLRPFKWRAKKQ